MPESDRDGTADEGPDGRDPLPEEHGHTAEDDDGVGHGEEGFLAEEYPGQNPLEGEGDHEQLERKRFTWTWPRADSDDAPRSWIERASEVSGRESDQDREG